MKIKINISILISALFFLTTFAVPKYTYAQGTFDCGDPNNTGLCYVVNNACDRANGWEPASNRCASWDGNKTACDKQTGLACVKPGVKYKCVSKQCVECTTGSDCIYFGPTACRADCEGSVVTQPSSGGVDIGTYFKSPFARDKTLGDLVSLILQLAFVISGFIILFMFIFAGYSFLMGAGNNDPQQAAKGRQAATAAATGFVVVFVAYWIVRLIENIIGVSFITETFSG